MITYYRQRAREYERVYTKPERQPDLAQLHAEVAATFAGHRVLEVSCGTGYWTETIARVAASVVACDLSPEVLDVARDKVWVAAKAEFRIADSYALPELTPSPTAAFAGFWWSHVPKRKLTDFLKGLHGRLSPGATVMFVDNRYVEGSNTPLSRIDEAGDSFQKRRLENGGTHEVLKNFPSEEELLRAVRALAVAPEVRLTDYFWSLRYKTRE